MKINQILLLKVIVALFLVTLTVINARMIVDNIVKSKGIDEKIVAEANPRLNKKLLWKALTTLESFSSQELTSISPSVTLEQESTNSGVREQSNISLEIQNASGIDGAASDLAEILASQGYTISKVSTAPTLQTQTTVTHKSGKLEEAEEIVQIIKNKGWTVQDSQESSVNQQYDILIVIGK